MQPTSSEFNPNAPEKTLREILPDLRPAQLRIVFAYLFHEITVEQFRASFIGTTGLKIKRLIDTSGYILRNCKLYAWAYHRAIRCGDDIPRFRHYGVSKSDAAFLRTLNLDKVPKKYPAMTQQQMTDMLGFVTEPDLVEYMGKFIGKKLIFLDKEFGMPVEEIQQTLVQTAIYAVYRAYPRFNPRTPGHHIAVAKIAVRNRGQNLIQENTTQSRQRMTKDNVPLVTYVHDAMEAPEQDSYVKDGAMTLASIEHKMTPKARRFLLIMSGQHDAEFSAYLGKDNSVAVERMDFDNYSSKVKKFFSASSRSVERMYSKIRARAGY